MVKVLIAVMQWMLFPSKSSSVGSDSTFNCFSHVLLIAKAKIKLGVFGAFAEFGCKFI